MKKTYFERAIFLSWYCAKGDCTFCYMSTQKNLINDPKKARRSFASIIAEAIISKNLNWKIEFLSVGYECYTKEEILFLLKTIHNIYREKLWLNIGVLNKEEIELFKPYIQGITGAVECINPKIHKKVCPSKPIKEITDMFEQNKDLKKSITIIIGLGETLDDIPLLIDFIKKYKLDKITLYALNPHKETPFEKGPETDYYIKWIKQIRTEFPEITIVAGSWVNRLSEISKLLKAGADNITKFPAIKLFNTEFAKQIQKQVKQAGREFLSTLTKLPDINWDNEINKLNINTELKQQIKEKLNLYLKRMQKN